MPSKIAKQSVSVATPFSAGRKSPRCAPNWDIEEERKYPSSDGRPMAQSSRQGRELTQAFSVLDHHYSKHPDIEVCPDVLIYYQENTQRCLAPDVFVALGVPKDRDRRTYKVWEEGRPPDWVLEILSASTHQNDLEPDEKQHIYCRMGVREVWLFDPKGEFTHPRLQGLHLAGQAYRPLPQIEAPQASLALFSPVLGLQLHVRDDSLRFWDPRAGQYLLNLAEAEQARLEERRGRLKAEREVRRLRKVLEGRPDQSSAHRE